jgi:hypothetical protein
MDTYKTSTERLRAVADLLEEEPHAYDQSVWLVVDEAYVSEELLVDAVGGSKFGFGAEPCNTRGCIAGWGITMTPADDPGMIATREFLAEWIERNEPWEYMGAVALGLESDLAGAIFHASYEPANMSEVLRKIATIPEGQRTLRNAFRAGVADWRGTYTHFGERGPVTIDSVDLPGDTPPVFSGATTMQDVIFQNVDLSGADFTDSLWKQVTFQGCALGGMDLSGSRFTGLRFVDCAGVQDIILNETYVTGEMQGAPSDWEKTPWGLIRPREE